MSIQLPNGEMLNLIFVSNVLIDNNNELKVLIQFVNNIDKQYICESASEATSLYNTIKNAMKGS